MLYYKGQFVNSVKKLLAGYSENRIITTAVVYLTTVVVNYNGRVKIEQLRRSVTEVEVSTGRSNSDGK
jgi:hypothetical protein